MPNWKKVIVSGSDAALNTLTVSNGITGSLQGTASYASNADSLDGKDSSIFATTGSNIFIGNQTVTGSLFTSGSNTLIGSTTLTGSLNITGSTTQVGNNNLLGNTTLSGSIIMSGAFGTNNPTVRIYGDTTHNGYIRFDPVTTNINPNISASYIYVSGSTNDLYFTQNGSGYNNTTRLRWLEGNLYSGLLNGGLLSTQSSTVYQVSSGSGIIVDLNASYTDNPYPIITYVNWPNLSASIAPLSASYDQTFVAIQPNGTIGVSSTPYTNGQIDTQIVIGIVTHNNRSTIDGVKTQPKVAYGWKQRSNIFIEAFGPLKLSGLTLGVSGSSIGSLIVGSGTAFQDGANYTTDANDPAYVSDTGTNVSKIYRYRQSGSNWVYDTNAGAGYGAIDPTNYSNNGVLTPVPTNNWSIQRVYYFPSSPSKVIIVYYGNAVYTTELDAIANINIEAFTEAPNTAANAVYLGALILRHNANFNTAASYKIIPGGLFRAVGGSGGGGGTVTQTLAGLSDVAISGPTDGQPLVYDSTLLKWKNASTLTASLSGTASYASNANSSSYALSASYALNTTSASYALSATSASYALNATSASNALTASYLNTLNQDLTFNGNLTLNGTASINYLNVIYETASVIYSSGSNQFGDASNDTQTLYGSVIVPTGSLTVSGSLTVFTGSGIELQVTDTGVKIGNAMSDSHTITGSLRISGSATAVSTSVFTIVPLTTLTASFTLNVNGTTIGRGTENHIIRGNSLAITGSLRVTGSNHTVIGNTTTTGNIIVTGSADITGSLNVTSGITGSLLGTASWASNAVTASYVLNAVSSSFATTASYVLNAVSSSFATTASYVLNAVSSSFASTASFVNTLNQNVNINGNVTITGSASNSLRVKGSGTTSATNALYVEDSSNTQTFTVRNDGVIRIGETRTDLQIDPVNSRIWFISPSSNGLIGFNSYNTFLYPTELVLYARSAIKGATNVLGDLRFYNLTTGQTYMYMTETGKISINKGTVTPNAELDISGSLIISGSAANALLVRGSGSATIATFQGSDGLYRAFFGNTQHVINVTNNGTLSIRPNEGTSNNPGFDFTTGTFGNFSTLSIATRYSIGTNGANNGQQGLLFQHTNYNIIAGFYRFIFSGGSTVITTTSGETGGIRYIDSFTAAAGSANYRPLSLTYTINNSGAQTGTATGIYLNATESALNSMTHNLMDLQVGGVSRFRIDNSGNTVITGSLTVITGSNIEFQVLNTGVKIGNVIGDIHTVTGSLRVSGSITGSLQGTASAAQTIISRYVCQGKLNADQSIVTSNDVVIQFVDDFDPNNWYNAGTYQFLPTVGGYYSISAGVWFDNTTDTNNQMNIQARKNGNSFALVQSPTNGATGQSLTFTKMVYLNGSTDYVDFSAYQSTGGNVNIQQGTADGSGTWFSAFLIST